MIFHIKLFRNPLIERAYKMAMRDLAKFYGIKWNKNMPRIIVVDDRKTIDALKSKKTESWLVGWTDRSRNIFVLNINSFGKESSRRYSRDQYNALIKHEISHLFINVLSENYNEYYPVWLHEGVAIYTSGQTKFKSRPSKFHEFLRFYNKGGSGIYQESGFFIELLVKKFGKNKLLRLIKSLKHISSKKQFETTFKRIFGFQLSYGTINKIYKMGH